MNALHTLGCACGQYIRLPAGKASWFGKELGDDYAIRSVAETYGWDHVVRADRFFVRCGRCVTRWPWEGGGNARDRRRRWRAFRPLKARAAFEQDQS